MIEWTSLAIDLIFLKCCELITSTLAEENLREDGDSAGLEVTGDTGLVRSTMRNDYRFLKIHHSALISKSNLKVLPSSWNVDA